MRKMSVWRDCYQVEMEMGGQGVSNGGEVCLAGVAGSWRGVEGLKELWRASKIGMTQ